VRTLLAVHAHPDDETIVTGGILARYSAEGVRTVIVTCTRGDVGGVADNVRVDASGLGALRERELNAAAATLGISRLDVLGYGDSGMLRATDNRPVNAFSNVDVGAAADQLLRIIEQERPQVMVTYDETGGYGHPDHVKAHQVAVAAFEAAGCRRPAKLYFVRFPEGWSRRFVAGLKREGIAAPSSAPAGVDAGQADVDIGVPDALVTTAIDVRRYVETKRAALACHRSQMPPDHFLMRMSRLFAGRMWAYEFFSREVGPTTARSGHLESDLFDGLG
jgi:LmbE family N-acetylglucosaminyl deacetylase